MRRSSRFTGALIAAAGMLAGCASTGDPIAVQAAHDIGDGRVPVFYTLPPAGPPRPGTMIRKQELEHSIGVPGAAEAWRILYGSTDGVDGRTPIAVSGVVFIPHGKRPDSGWPILAWAHGTVGMADICAPSLQGRSYRDAQYLKRWLDEGFAVVATDYQGLGAPGPHPYMNVRPAAYSVLDSIRAARSAFPILGTQSVIAGQSQGGQAAVAAAIYAHAYAPELDIRATVATGATNLKAGDASLGLGPEAGFTATADATVYYRLYLLMMAMQSQPDLSPDNILTPEGLGLFGQAQGVCNTRLEADVRALSATRLTAFKPGALNRALAPVADRMAYPHLKVTGALFLGIGEDDLEVPAQGQLALARDACAQGSVVEARLYARASHSAVVNGSLKDSIPFVRKALNGQPLQSTCSPSPE